MEGLRVLELSERVPGTHCGRLLAEQGAEVILIESPDGHPLRRQKPFADEDRHPEKSLEFGHYNVNKRGVTLDPDRTDGRKLFDSLVETADVVVVDQPPTHRLRKEVLSYDRLSEVNPEIIVTSITPYGLTGSKREYSADDLPIQAMGGFPQINGHPDRAPLRLPNNQAGHMGAINAMIGTLSAIFYRKFNHGTGQLVDVSQQEAVLIHLEHHLQFETLDSYPQNPLFPEYHIGRRSGRFFTPGIPIGLFPCKDGWVCLGGVQEHEIKAIVDFFDTEELNQLDEEGRLDNPMSNRVQYGQEIIEAVESATREYRAKELEQQGQDAEIAISMVKDPAELLEDEHFRHNDFIREVNHPNIGKMRTVGPEARTQTAKEVEFTPAPQLGEHNQSVYNDLGLDADELRDEGVI